MALTLEQVVIRQDGFELHADWSVSTGACVAVIGPSGAGKSTLLGAIAGFVPVAEGRIAWQGRDIGQDAPGQRPLAMLFQDNNLFPHLTLAQNVGLGLRPDLRLSAAERAEVDAALTQVGLDGMGARRPGQVSGGQQGRAALARILVQKRPLILLDEPFAALGPALKAEMLDLVAELAAQSGASLLMVSHDPGDARRIAAQTVLVADGVAHAPTATAPLLDAPPEALRAYLGT